MTGIPRGEAPTNAQPKHHGGIGPCWEFNRSLPCVSFENLTGDLILLQNPQQKRQRCRWPRYAAVYKPLCYGYAVPRGSNPSLSAITLVI